MKVYKKTIFDKTKNICYIMELDDKQYDSTCCSNYQIISHSDEKSDSIKWITIQREDIPPE